MGDLCLQNLVILVRIFQTLTYSQACLRAVWGQTHTSGTSLRQGIFENFSIQNLLNSRLHISLRRLELACLPSSHPYSYSLWFSQNILDYC